MNRREFVTTLLAGGSVALLKLGVDGCAATPRRPDGSIEDVPLDRFLATGARVMWIAAHPDDECFSGSLLARASIHHGNPLHMLILTRGEGGECCRPEGCDPDLGTVRAGEMAKVAAMYRATLRHEAFWNAPLPMESFPKRHEIYAKWLTRRDPLPLVAEVVRGFKPDLVLTFDPDHGATGHPEHQLASRLATTGVRLAADASADFAGLPVHRVERVYYILNRLFLMKVAGAADPGPVTETFDATLPCTPGLSCLDFMCHATEFHRTQANDMGTVRRFRSLFATMNLRRMDPYREAREPWEEAREV